MKRFRKVVFWLHLVAGIAAGVVVLLMSATGVLLAFERQMLEAAESVEVAPPSPDAPRLSVGELVSGAAAGKGAAPTAVTISRDPSAPVEVAFGRESVLRLDPWTGEAVEGGTAVGLRGFFRAVTNLHRWLAMEGESRATGRAITGAANAVFLFIVVSGLYLWFPRKWSRAMLRSILWFRPDARGKARDFNWHNVLGFWSCVPLALIVFTGVLISYPWATAMLYRVAGEDPPPPRSGPPRGGRGAPPAADAAATDFTGLDAALAAAVMQMPEWNTISLRLPAGKDGLAVSVMGSHRGRPDLRTTVTVDPATAEVVSTESFDDQSRARQWRSWGRWIHTGEAGGFVGQIVAALVSAAACVLVWTGFALSWRRFFGRRRKPRPAAPARVPEPAAVD